MHDLYFGIILTDNLLACLQRGTAFFAEWILRCVGKKFNFVGYDTSSSFRLTLTGKLEKARDFRFPGPRDAEL
jgi:hypothetical protein